MVFQCPAFIAQNQSALACTSLMTIPLIGNPTKGFSYQWPSGSGLLVGFNFYACCLPCWKGNAGQWFQAQFQYTIRNTSFLQREK